MKITQVSSNNWKASESLGYVNGKQVKIRKQGFKTKKEAKEWLMTEIEKYRNGFTPSNGNILFKDYITSWFNDFKSISLAYNTRANYISRINTYIIPYFGQYKLNEINNQLVQNFYNNLIKQGLKPSSVKKIIEILSGVFKYAYKNKLIYNIPLDISRQPLDKPKLEVWTKQEVDYFLDKIKDSYLYLPVFMEVLIGTRPAELCAIKWSDIDFINNKVSINKQVIVNRENSILYLTDTLKTTTSHRVITIPPILTYYLKEVKSEREADDNDFIIKELSSENKMCNPNNLNANFTSKINSLNKSNTGKLSYISFNGLRHTHATLLVQNGENIKTISKRLGHKDINTTLKYYTHVTAEMENNTATLLNNIFSK